jgi:hypothetical protein
VDCIATVSIPHYFSHAMARWSRYDIIAIDEVGYVPLAEVGREFLFQVIAERAERTAVVITTNTWGGLCRLRTTEKMAIIQIVAADHHAFDLYCGTNPGLF